MARVAWGEWTPIDADLSRAKETLRRLGYGRIRVLPLRKKPISPRLLVHEGLNVVRFCLGKRNLFGVTVSPDVFRGMFAFLTPRTHLLYRLFFLNERIPKDSVSQLLNCEDLEVLTASRALLDDEDGTGYLSPLRWVPYRHDLFITDPWDRGITELCYLSYDSLFLADFVREFVEGKRFDRALDLCTGVGVLACSLAKSCDSVLGSDINRRAIFYAKLNAALNQRANVEFIAADLFEGLPGRFNLIVCNPPFVFLPDSLQGNMIDSAGGQLGIGVALRILQQLSDHLSTGGMAILLSRAPVAGGEDVLKEQVASIASQNKWKARYIEIAQQPLTRDYLEFYRCHSISGFRMVVLTIQQAGRYEMKECSSLLGSVRHQF